MDYAEFETLAMKVADRLDGTVLPFEPGELPSIVFELDGVDLAAELSPV